MSDKITVESIPDLPLIQEGDDIGRLIADAASGAGISIEDQDIFCIASKAVSCAEGRTIQLADIKATKTALEIQKKVPKKDARTIQVIIDQTGELDGSRVEVGDNYIAGWLPNGLRLTSAGVDKLDEESVILLPKNPDQSARNIGKTIMNLCSKKVGVIITDSDGRIEKLGSTQLAVGLYGVPALRLSEASTSKQNTKLTEETTCDMLAASAALLMGQRGTNKPVVLIRGYSYEFMENSSIVDSLSKPSKPRDS